MQLLQAGHRVRERQQQVTAASRQLLGYEGPDEILSLPSLRTVFAPYEHARLSRYGQARLSGGASQNTRS